MIEFGRTLRAAREAKGYTVAQIAETTHMAHSTVEELEREDFTRIAAPIYGRGFVRLYCEAVGLDPKPLIAEFMDIYNGNRDLGIKERPVKQPEPTSTAEEPPPPAAEPPETAVEPPEPTAAPEPDLFSPQLDTPPAEQPRLSRYAAPISQGQSFSPTATWLSPAIWRIAALVCAAIVILWIGFIGLRALYHATSTPDDSKQSDSAPTAEEMQTQAKKPAEKPSQKPAAPQKARTPQNIPTLYID